MIEAGESTVHVISTQNINLNFGQCNIWILLLAKSSLWYDFMQKKNKSVQALFSFCRFQHESESICPALPLGLSPHLWTCPLLWADFFSVLTQDPAGWHWLSEEGGPGLELNPGLCSEDSVRTLYLMSYWNSEESASLHTWQSSQGWAPSPVCWWWCWRSCP